MNSSKTPNSTLIKPEVRGIHHVTAIAGDPQDNLNFYSGVLGLKLIKKTVNFDDRHTYHFYFGNESGNPGTILTFFPWTREAARGKKGVGQLTTISFSIPPSALDFWMERLNKLRINFSGPEKRFNDSVISFEDPDGIELEFITSSKDNRHQFENNDIPKNFSVRGFHSVTLSEERSNRTLELLISLLGFRKVAEEENRFRIESGSGGPGTYVDILVNPNLMPGRMGVGVVHHVAWRAKDDEVQVTLQGKLVDEGYNVTPVIDRNYFHSIYFKEPGNILFEIATDPPGFMVDESKENLGTSLKLPPWLENCREEIEAALPKVNLPVAAKSGSSVKA
jgi:catechol 2,3-dioxygenase-like lactoylglutathione lyase family enzyme